MGEEYNSILPIVASLALQPPKLATPKLNFSPDYLQALPVSPYKNQVLDYWNKAFPTPQLKTPDFSKVNNVLSKGQTAAKKGFFGSIGDTFKLNPNLWGTAAMIGNYALGPKSEYSGKYGSYTQAGDAIYDIAANTIPGAWPWMQGAKFLGTAINKLGGGTDGNTVGDAIMGTAGLNLTPLGLINGFTGKRADKLNHLNYLDLQRLANTFGAYNQDDEEMVKAKELSNSKFGGIFGRGGLRSANTLIGEQNQDIITRLAIAKDMNLQKVKSQYMTSINNQNYLNLINGILNPIPIGLKGIKMNKRRLKRISKMANERLLKPVDEYSMFLSVLPENLRTEDPEYNMKRYWELNDKPKTWFEALNKGMFNKEKDGFWHSNTVAYNKDSDEYEFMKSPNHPTINKELEWYDSPEGFEFAKLYELIKPEDGSNYKYIRRLITLDNPQAFKSGGLMNLIPEGALHARKNNLEGAGKDFTAKGIPVISMENGEQVAEIERDELIINKDNTDYIEERYKKFYSDDISESDKDKLAIEVGKRFVKELMTNTDDRTGLIELVESKV